MRGLSLTLALCAGCVFIADQPEEFPADDAPPASGGEGEGEPSGAGEGEGEPVVVGEGEGEPAQVGEGEGEPAPGGGEGEPAPGEGEGEPAPGEGEGEPAPGEGEGEGEGEPVIERECDLLDDDGDGEFDEVDVAAERLFVTFDDRTAIFPGAGVIQIRDRNGTVVDDRDYTSDELRGLTVEVEGDTVQIRMEIRDADRGLFGYKVASIVDQAGREAPLGELPESEHPHPLNVDELREFVFVDSLGMGGYCGTEVGECVRGRDQCVGGETVCVGGVRAEDDDVCDDRDNDCDGTVDEDNGGAYEFVEATCDCHDNDCDEVVDGRAGDGDGEPSYLPCTLAELLAAEPATPGVCTVRNPGMQGNVVGRAPGELVVEDGMRLIAPNPPHGEGCGHRGGGHAHLGGACLHLGASRIVVGGRLAANGEGGGCGGECGGGSGGDVALWADEIELLATAVVQATGGSGGHQARDTAVGGAGGGSIRLRAPRIVVEAGASLTCAGGGSSSGPSGEGCGGAGGRGSGQFGKGGAGAAGPGGVGENRNAGGDSAERGLVITGQLFPADRRLVVAGSGSGHVTLEGAVAALSDDEAPLAGDGRLHRRRLALRLTDVEGRPLVGESIRWIPEGEDAPIVEGVTGEGGWWAGDPELNEGRSHTAEGPDGATLHVSYGRERTDVVCVLETILDGGSAELPAVGVCAR